MRGLGDLIPGEPGRVADRPLRHRRRVAVGEDIEPEAVAPVLGNATLVASQQHRFNCRAEALYFDQPQLVSAEIETKAERSHYDGKVPHHQSQEQLELKEYGRAPPGQKTSKPRGVISYVVPCQNSALLKQTTNHRTRTLSELNLRRLGSAKPGESNAYMERTDYGDLSLDCHKRVNERLQTRCFSDVYTRMHPNRPSPTVTTKCHSISNGRFGHYDPAQVRGISLREAAILQSFPDDYVFYPTEQIEPVARMIGNAVPPKLAAFYARYLANSLCDDG